jgi:hypothetical protein
VPDGRGLGVEVAWRVALALGERDSGVPLLLRPVLGRAPAGELGASLDPSSALVSDDDGDEASGEPVEGL